MNGKVLLGFLLLLILVIPLSASGGVLNANGLQIDRWVIGGGGGHVEAGGYALTATAGQALVGDVASDPYELCAGFWCGMSPYKVYLPLLVRQE